MRLRFTINDGLSARAFISLKPNGIASEYYEKWRWRRRRRRIDPDRYNVREPNEIISLNSALTSRKQKSEKKTNRSNRN